MAGRTARARATIYVPKAVQLSLFNARRHIPDAIANHPLADRFDSDTLFFDMFTVAWDAVLAIGPPLVDCAPSTAISVPRGAHIRVRTQPHRIPQQFATRTWFTGAGAGERRTIELEANGVRRSVAVNADCSGLLADRRVVVTVSQDNPLIWVRDWAEFYVRKHGADAILIYDNNSTNYAPDEIVDTLAGIDGLAEIVVVPWPFTYGVGGPAPGQPALDNFCQTGALDHARRCLCRRARSVLNVDIDELVLADGLSIFERVEQSPHAAILFHGIWTEAAGVADAASHSSVRHRDCVFAWREQLDAFAAGRLTPLCRSKWVCVPARCSDQVEWGVHEIYAAGRWARFTRRFWLSRDRSIAHRHCRQINTGWKLERWRTSEDFASRCTKDAAMAAAMRDVFGTSAST
jgi:hypothetical protein